MKCRFRKFQSCLFSHSILKFWLLKLGYYGIKMFKLYIFLSHHYLSYLKMHHCYVFIFGNGRKETENKRKEKLHPWESYPSSICQQERRDALRRTKKNLQPVIHGSS